MTTQQFQELIQRYREDNLSEEGWTALRAALDSGMFDEMLEEDIRQVFEDAGAEEWGTDVTPAPEEVQVNPARVRKLERRVRWVAAAAAAVLLLTAGLFIYHQEKGKPAPAIAAAPAAIRPGTSKAILVLAGGQRVVLDEAEKGTVASQGGIHIIKLDSGLLTYNGKKDGSQEVMYNTVITPRGGQFQLVLADGTKVWLNAASSLRFPTSFSGKEREVELTGEGYFEVKHNSRQPFRVKAGRQIVEDIGTAFNINAYDDEPAARTTLIEGAVKVTGSSTVGLRPGQQARVMTDGIVMLSDKVNIAEVIAWKNGQIAFTNADFSELMREIGRWYDVNIHYDGVAPKAHFFAILNRNVSLSSIIEYLQKNGVHIQQAGREIFILP